jgi:hypothetical protein
MTVVVIFLICDAAAALGAVFLDWNVLSYGPVRLIGKKGIQALLIMKAVLVLGAVGWILCARVHT